MHATQSAVTQPQSTNLQLTTPRLTHSRLTKKLALLSFAALLCAGTLPAFAADGDGMQSFARETQQMANKDGMVAKRDFMKMMEKKFDAMDKAHKGMLSPTDIMRIFNDNTGS
jgi:hypothetical protein